MADSLSAVYDLGYPSPITLKEITSIVVVVELWRKEINAYLQSNNPDKFHLTQHIRPKNLIPDMPSIIYNQLSDYIVTFRKSIKSWLLYHRDKVVISRDDNEDKFNNILSRFRDFSWDWNGAIHYVRTARRMMQCDRLSLEEKFRIACLYCFENDIKRIWPSVSSKIDLRKFCLTTFPQLFYWVDELLKSPHTYYSYILSSMEGILYSDISVNQSSLEYFWNRLPSEGRTRPPVYLYGTRVELFARFILPQLSEHELEVFLTKCGFRLIYTLVVCDLGRWSVLPIWMYIRNKISGPEFRKVIAYLLLLEIRGDLPGSSKLKIVMYLCDEIWCSAPRHLKQPVFDYLLLEPSSFLGSRRRIMPTKPRQMKLLIAILRDATFEERSSFWHKHWTSLRRGAVIEDLLEMTKLCFRNEDEISLFKNDIMSAYENNDYYCIFFLNVGAIDKLNEYLDFCCLDEQKRRQQKQRILLLANLAVRVSWGLYRTFKPLNKFIDDAFERNDVSVEFKNQFISSPITKQFLFTCIREGDFFPLMDFVDTFVLEQPVIESLKTRLYDYFKKQLITGWFSAVQPVNPDQVRRILMWFLGNEDEVTRFKQSLPVDDIFRNIVHSKPKNRPSNRRGGRRRKKIHGKIDNFLMWYFNEDDGKICRFKKRFPHELKLLEPCS
ncbi:uncharacterized protein LOC135834031 [Planococcus citri]|uniref:uncharacterized protein LOC135834031 n=1 Tax=Planococcus citri TaxID=170843 RepID=UPI0031F7B897